MKDCDGNELAVGDVVEVVAYPSVYEYTVEQVVGELAFVRASSHDNVWTDWYTPSELRLVRRKEMTNG